MKTVIKTVINDWARRANQWRKSAAAVTALGCLTLSSLALGAPHAAANLPEINVNNGFAELVQAVKPAVVNISTTERAPARQQFGGGYPPELDEFFERFFGAPRRPFGNRRSPPRSRPPKSMSLGSGFVISEQGLVVTNHHVIEDADEIEVVFDDGSRHAATLKGKDEKTDLALLQIDAGKPLPYLKFGDSDAARVGDWVVAIGNPFGLGGTTTSGIISARGRDIQSGLVDFIQIDAPINRGNSGGPLFNIKGEVIGVNSAIYSPHGGNVGIGFAIPSSTASQVIGQLRDRGVVRRGYLGVHIQSIDEELAESLGLVKPQGALVTDVVEGTPAERAGIQAGDVILSYNGKEVEKMRDLPKFVARTKKGTRVNVVVWRNERRKVLRVSVGSSDDDEIAATNRANPADAKELGIVVAALNDTYRERYDLENDAEGVVIVEVEPDGAAAESGLREGDIIKRLGSATVKSPADVKTSIARARKANKKTLLVMVERAQQNRFLAISLES